MLFFSPVLLWIFLLFIIMNTVLNSFATNPFDAMNCKMVFESSSNFSTTYSCGLPWQLVLVSSAKVKILEWFVHSLRPAPYTIYERRKNSSFRYSILCFQLVWNGLSHLDSLTFIVDLLGLNPCWLSGSSLWASIKLDTWSLTIFNNTFELLDQGFLTFFRLRHL